MQTRAAYFPVFLTPFRVAGFPGLWVSASSGAFARVVTQLVLTWVTLEATDSPFMVGVVTAARMVPSFLLGIPAGALADWADRRRLVMVVSGGSVLVILALIPLVLLDLTTSVVLIAVSALLGTLDTLRMAATQAYAYDLVRTSRATSGMALTNLGVQLLSTLGGLLGGFVLDRFGSAATFGLIALSLLISAVGPALGTDPGDVRASSEASRGEPPARLPDPLPRPPDPPAKRTRPDFESAMLLLVRNRFLAILALGILLAEILGFAGQTLLPTFAHDVWDVGASGLGTMLAVRSGGGALGLLLLAWIGAEGRAGRFFVSFMTGLGLMCLLFGQAPAYGPGLVFLGLVGLCSSIMDTLGQTLMQRNAGETERGAAMGLWIFSVGFGPVGHLTLGAAATAYGAPVTQTVAGGLLAIIGLLLSLNRPLRRAR